MHVFRAKWERSKHNNYKVRYGQNLFLDGNCSPSYSRPLMHSTNPVSNRLMKVLHAILLYISLLFRDFYFSSHDTKKKKKKNSEPLNQNRKCRTFCLHAQQTAAMIRPAQCEWKQTFNWFPAISSDSRSVFGMIAKDFRDTTGGGFFSVCFWTGRREVNRQMLNRCDFDTANALILSGRLAKRSESL